MYIQKHFKTIVSILFAFLLISGNVAMAGSLVVNNFQVLPHDSIAIIVDGVSGDQDWVGIYRKNDSNAMSNVLSWGWVGNGTSSLGGVPGAGEYEARLFFHNSFKVEARYSFRVSAHPSNSNAGAMNSVLALLLQEEDGVASITTSQPSYSLNENIKVMLGGLSGDQDWVGIYRKNDSNKWDNVLSWGWATGGKLPLDGISQGGEYEVRLFFHNSFNTEATFAFSVNDNNNVVVENYPDKHYVVYRPIIHLENAPILLVVSYRTVLGDPDDPAYVQRFEGLMRFIASQGVYVIGHTANTVGDAVSDGLIPLFETALTESLGKYPTLDKSKFGIIGQSRGGGQVFKIMQYFKGHQYGSAHSFVVPLDGSFAHEMSTADLNNLHTDALFIQFGGAIGNITDPRRTLSINKLLPGDTNKGFVTIDTNLNHGWDDHIYGHGDLETFLTKRKLASSINGIVDYELFDINNGKNVVFNPDNTAATIQDIVNNLKPNPQDYSYACDGHGTAEGGSNYHFLRDVDYCTAYLP
jgi:hypothetical protein